MTICFSLPTGTMHFPIGYSKEPCCSGGYISPTPLLSAVGSFPKLFVGVAPCVNYGGENAIDLNIVLRPSSHSENTLNNGCVGNVGHHPITVLSCCRNNVYCWCDTCWGKCFLCILLVVLVPL